MADKQVTLILYAANRNLWQSGDFTLKVRRFDSHGIKEMRFQSDGQNRTELKSNQSTLQLDLNLAFNAGQRYFLYVDAPKHRGIFHVLHRRSFITREEDGAEVERRNVIIRTIMIPNSAEASDLNPGFDKLKDRGSHLVKKGIGISRKKYNALEPAAKMAMLNIEAKLRATRINGNALSASVTGLRHVEPDRIYVMMQPQIKGVVDESPAFASAPGHGKKKGIELPAHPDSWKHRTFPVGNLQLSFSKDPENWPNPSSDEERSFSVDADIDLEKGVKHWGEWLKNNVIKPGHKTDQTVVYGLLFGQGILPDYTLDPKKVS